VLEYGINAVMQPLGAGITPEYVPSMESARKKAESTLLSGAAFLEDEAREVYTEEELSQPGTFPYTVTLGQEDEVAWIYGWCATPDKIESNMAAIDLTFKLEDEVVPLEQLHILDYPVDDTLSCQFIYQILSDFAPGEHHLSILVEFTQPIDDGASVYPAGEWLYDYTVYVKP
jgi:hypothetical protein